jgi:hypothetical protein
MKAQSREKTKSVTFTLEMCKIAKKKNEGNKQANREE